MEAATSRPPSSAAHATRPMARPGNKVSTSRPVDESRAGRSVNRELTSVASAFTLDTVIVSFRHAGLRELFETGKSRKVQPDLHKRCRRAMDALHAATAVSDLNMPGWSVHPLKGNREGRHAMAVSGPWRITFRWDGKDAHELALEQYH
jgi:toxin HigB-1